MKIFLIFVCLLINFVFADKYPTWQEHKANYKLKFEDPEEEKASEKIYEKNCNKIKKHNARHALGYETYKLNLNGYSHMSEDRFKAGKTGYQPPPTFKRTPMKVKSVFSYHKLPKQVNWAKNGSVTPVKNQGECGSCWAFTTAAVLEHCYFVIYGESKNLSEQSLIDCACTAEYGNFGCNGGRMTDAMEYTKKNGIASKTEYPYRGDDLEGCKQDVTANIVNSGFEMVAKSELEMQRALAEHGPLAAGISSTSDHLQLYSNGVFDTFKCSKYLIDHAIVIIGYGEMKIRGRIVKFWIIKNTWGTSWGQRGFIFLKRGVNSCGIIQYVSFAKCAAAAARK